MKTGKLKKPGRTRMVLVIMLITVFVLFIFQSMKDGKPSELLIMAIPIIIGGILLIEFVIAKRVYPPEKEKEREELEKGEVEVKGD